MTNVSNWLNRTGCGTASKALPTGSSATIDRLDFAQRQKLLRLVVDEVRVAGWQVEIRFRIPLDSPPEPPNTRVSSKDRLRSLHGDERRKLSASLRDNAPAPAPGSSPRQQPRKEGDRSNFVTLRDTNFLSRSVAQGILAPRSDRTSICRAPAIPSVALQLVAHHDPQPPVLVLPRAGGEHRDVCRRHTARRRRGCGGRSPRRAA